MWKAYKNDSTFYIKVESIDRHSFKVSVTNYVKLWSRQFDNDGIIKIMLESNKNVECPGHQRFLEAGLSMLMEPKQVHEMMFTESNGHLNIRLIHKGDIVLKMNLSLSACCAEHFFDSVTRPLLLIIHDQKESETELRRHLKGIRGFLKKIPEDLLMRFEKNEIKEFNDEEHMKSHNVLEELFGTDVDERINPMDILNGCPLPALPYDTPLPIKEEPDSSDPGPSIAATTDTSRGIKTEPPHSNVIRESSKTTSVSANICSRSDPGPSMVATTGTLIASRGIKTEPLHSDGTRELNSSASGSSKVTNEPSDGASHPRATRSTGAQESTSSIPKKRRKNLNY